MTHLLRVGAAVAGSALVLEVQHGDSVVHQRIALSAQAAQLAPNVVADRLRGALPELLAHPDAYDAVLKAVTHIHAYSAAKSSATSATGNDVKRAIEGIGDLQKVGAAALQAAKAKMEVVFEAHRLKPGDPGFVYDKRTEFAPSEPSEWD